MIKDWIGRCQVPGFWLEAWAGEGTSREQVGLPAVASRVLLSGFRRHRLALVSGTLSFQGGFGGAS